MGGVLGHLLLTVLCLADRSRTVALLVVEMYLLLSLITGSEVYPRAVRTSYSDCNLLLWQLSLPLRLAGRFPLSSHCAMELVPAQQVWSSSRLLASLARTSLLVGHKEKDHCRPRCI